MAKLEGVREVSVDKLVIGESQVRVRQVDSGLDELADSIRRHGLLEPIVVCPTGSKGYYEVVMGQRRLLAHRKLGRSTILAAVIDEPVDEPTAKALSLTENLIRRDLDSKDVIDACTTLYKKYGSARAVAEETGLPYAQVLKHIKYDRLAPALQRAVDSGEVLVDVALKAQDAATFSDMVDEEDALGLARGLSKMTGVQRRQVLQARQRDPEQPVSELLMLAQPATRMRQIVVTLTTDDHRSLQAYAKKRQMTQDEAAAELITAALHQT
jgi:ParB family chromosome partitioning protein